MKYDGSRFTFDPQNHFSQLFMQQGRVTLDADWNEHAAIFLHYLRMLTRDLIGPYAAPVESPGFRLRTDPSIDQGAIRISAGRYYVDGILVENDQECRLTEQPYYKFSPSDDPIKQAKLGEPFWLYLDVWERHITAIENDAIREQALGGPDTCTRAQVVWQVKSLSIKATREQVNLANQRASDRIQALQAQKANAPAADSEIFVREISKLEEEIKRRERFLGDQGRACESPLYTIDKVSGALLAARVDPGQKIADACVTSPDSKYRGAGNQLYRVEIHQGGTATEATFIWSRDNGSVATEWLNPADNGPETPNSLAVRNARGFSAGDWVEVSSDAAELQDGPSVLLKLAKVEGDKLSVDPDSLPAEGMPQWSKELVSPKVRRWDQKQTEDIILIQGAVPVTETPFSASPDKIIWIDLEDGVQIRFAEGGNYRRGDYWVFPARVATGNIEWPIEDKRGKASPKLLAPRGVIHHYAPLGFVHVLDGADLSPHLKLCHCEFEPQSSCFSTGSAAFGANLLRLGEQEAVINETQSARLSKVSDPPASPTKTSRPASKKRKQ